MNTCATCRRKDGWTCRSFQRLGEATNQSEDRERLFADCVPLQRPRRPRSISCATFPTIYRVSSLAWKRIGWPTKSTTRRRGPLPARSCGEVEERGFRAAIEAFEFNRVIKTRPKRRKELSSSLREASSLPTHAVSRMALHFQIREIDVWFCIVKPFSRRY